MGIQLRMHPFLGVGRAQAPICVFAAYPEHASRVDHQEVVEADANLVDYDVLRNLKW